MTASSRSGRCIRRDGRLSGGRTRSGGSQTCQRDRPRHDYGPVRTGYFMRLPQQAHLIKATTTVCQTVAPRRHQSAREDACLRAGSVVQGDIRQRTPFGNRSWSNTRTIFSRCRSHTQCIFSWVTLISCRIRWRGSPRAGTKYSWIRFRTRVSGFSLEESHDFKQARPMGGASNQQGRCLGRPLRSRLEGMGRRQDGIEWSTHMKKRGRGIFAGICVAPPCIILNWNASMIW